MSENIDDYKGIAIIGMSGRFPGANSISEFWDNIEQGVESITFFSDEELRKAKIPEGDINNPHYVKAWGIMDEVELRSFDAQFFGFSPREAVLMDPQHRLMLQCSWEAMEDAGYNPARFNGSIGVFVGSSVSSYMMKNIMSNPDIYESSDTYQLMIGNDQSFVATKISYAMDLKGPSLNLLTACSTSMVAVHTACQTLLYYESDMAIAGGAGIKNPQVQGYYYTDGGILSPDGHCKAFDANANGTIGGNGIGLVVLKRLQDAVEDGDHIYAVIKGSAINNDGSMKIGYTAPGVEGQIDVIKEALSIAEIDPGTITLVEAHGTGTALGDPIEIEALTSAYQEQVNEKQYCAITSTKSNIGHIDAAAGVSGLIKVVLSLHNKKIPPSINYQKPNPKIDFANSPFYVNTKLQEWKTKGFPLRAAVSSFGIGGTNAHVVLEEAPKLPRIKKIYPKQIVSISAKSEFSLDKMMKNLQTFLLESNADIADVAFTLHTGRKEFPHRLALVCKDKQSAIDILANAGSAKLFKAKCGDAVPRIVFMFPGQGSQYVSMGKELYQHVSVFREQLDECADILKPQLQLDIREVLFPTEQSVKDTQEKITETWLTQPVLFSIEYAMAKMLMSWGIQPAAMIGHSIGEYVAACLAGVFSLQDALKITAIRGKLIWELPRGAMLSVYMSADEAARYAHDAISLATINAKSLCVLSGTIDAIAQLAEKLKKDGVESRVLHTSHAFHSHMMEPILSSFSAELKKIQLHQPEIPYISNVSGTWVRGDEATSVEYWIRHLRSAVNFSDGIDELLHNQNNMCIEVGPGNTLGTFSRQNDQAKQSTIISTLPHPKDKASDFEVLLEALTKIWLQGGEIDWTAFYAEQNCSKISVPTYAFDKQSYWIEPGDHAIAAKNQKAKKLNIPNWFYEPSWKMKSVLPSVTNEQLTILLFLDEEGVGELLIKSLQSDNLKVISVVKGAVYKKNSDNSFTINPANEKDYASLLKNLKEMNMLPHKIIHMLSITDHANILNGRANFTAIQELGFKSLESLARSLNKQGIAEPLDIYALSNGICEITGAEYLYPEKATILGPLCVIPQENAHINCKYIDIELAEQSRFVEHVRNEIYHTILDGPVVAFRGNNRWVQDFNLLDIKRSSNNLYIKEKGVYVITGGAGNVGLLMAEFIASHCNSTIVLLGRTQYPNKNEWESYLQTHTDSDTMYKKIAQFKKIESLGAEVFVYSADIAVADQVNMLFDEIENKHGKINGIIHAAGFIDLNEFKNIEDSDEQTYKRHFGPKIYGIYALEEALKNRAIDFCMLTSSLSTVLGGNGYSSYAAANNFLDIYASNKNKDSKFPWITLNFDGFHFEEQISSTGLDGNALGKVEFIIKQDEAHEMFSYLFTKNQMRHLYVSTGDLAYRVNAIATAKDIVKSLASRIEKNQDNLHDRPHLSVVYVAPAGETEKMVASLWTDLLGIKAIGIHDNFIELGGHSLLATQLISRVKEKFNINFNLASFFENPTIEGIAKIIEREELSQIEEDDLGSLLDELEDMPGDEVNK